MSWAVLAAGDGCVRGPRGQGVPLAARGVPGWGLWLDPTPFFHPGLANLVVPPLLCRCGGPHRDAGGGEGAGGAGGERTPGRWGWGGLRGCYGAAARLLLCSHNSDDGAAAAGDFFFFILDESKIFSSFGFFFFSAGAAVSPE